MQEPKFVEQEGTSPVLNQRETLTCTRKIKLTAILKDTNQFENIETQEEKVELIMNQIPAYQMTNNPDDLLRELEKKKEQNRNIKDAQGDSSRDMSESKKKATKEMLHNLSKSKRGNQIKRMGIIKIQRRTYFKEAVRILICTDEMEKSEKRKKRI